MSRAFVKEGDGEELDDAPPRPPRVQPCYMTARGIAAFRAELEGLQRDTRTGEIELAQLADHKRAQKRMHEIAQILGDAVPVEVGRQSGGIVREDETAPAAGRISWVSPLGRQLIGKAVGDEVSWKRASGELNLEVMAFAYVE